MTIVNGYARLAYDVCSYITFFDDAPPSGSRMG
jgi:hypothetical protein